MKKAERNKLYMSLSPHQRRCYMDNYMRTISRKVLPPVLAAVFVVMTLTIVVFALVVENPTQRQTYTMIFSGAGGMTICIFAVLFVVAPRIAEQELRRAKDLPVADPVQHEQQPGATTPPYAIQWRGYRQRRMLFWVAMAVFLPVVLATHRLHFDLRLPICTIAVIILFVARWRLDHWRCPRCGQPFFKTKWFGSGLTKECLHCGLPKWAGLHSQEGSSNPASQGTLEDSRP